MTVWASVCGVSPRVRAAQTAQSLLSVANDHSRTHTIPAFHVSALIVPLGCLPAGPSGRRGYAGGVSRGAAADAHKPLPLCLRPSAPLVPVQRPAPSHSGSLLFRIRHILLCSGALATSAARGTGARSLARAAVRARRPRRGGSGRRLELERGSIFRAPTDVLLSEVGAPPLSRLSPLHSLDRAPAPITFKLIPLIQILTVPPFLLIHQHPKVSIHNPLPIIPIMSPTAPSAPQAQQMMG